MKSIPFSEVRASYERLKPDGHWFDKDTIRFFRTKLPTTAYEVETGVLFVTSERSSFSRPERRYTVRLQNLDGDITTVGGFCDHDTRASAMRALRRYARKVDGSGPERVWESSCGRIVLRMTLGHAQAGVGPTNCYDDIQALRQMRTIKPQLDKLHPKDVAKCLSEYGAWTLAELNDHDANIGRLLWVATGDIIEGNT